MNICLLTSSYPIDENDIAAPFIPPFVHEVETRGHSVVVFAPAKPGAAPGWSADGKVYHFDWLASDQRVVDLKFSSPADVLRMASLFVNGEQQLRRVIRECETDTCLALWAIPSGYLAWRAKQTRRVPYVVWALGSDIHTWAKYPVVGSVIKRVLSNADACFADGFELSRQASALASVDCQFLSSARQLPFDQFMPAEFSKRPAHFLFVGRWEKIKGVDILLEAFHLLVDEIGSDRADLCILGSGSQEPAMRKRIAEHHLGDLVRLVPNAPRSLLVGCLRQASCLVIPSRSESIPLVFGEGLQAHLPLIVSDVGDMGDLAREYRVGHVVPPSDAIALKDAMCQFISRGRIADPRDQELLHLLDLRTSAERFVETIRSFGGGKA